MKESVFPFAKFPGADTILGPEMRSTGEVMGIAETFALSFAKSMLASGVEVGPPRRPGARDGKVVHQREGRGQAGRRASSRGGCGRWGSRSSRRAGPLRRSSARGSRPRSINKVNEGTPHVVDALRSGKVAIVINTTIGAKEVRDSFSLRRQTLLENIPYFTTIAAALAACDAIEAQGQETMSITSLQEWNAGTPPRDVSDVDKSAALNKVHTLSP